MTNWLKSFRERFEDALHQLLWRQWSLLGISATAPPDDRWLIDPEALVLFTLEGARSEPRLFDEVLDWLVTNGALLDVQRLRNICERDEGYPRAILQAAALVLAQQDTSGKWNRLSEMEPGTRRDTEPFFLDLAESNPMGQVKSPDPSFARSGFARAAFSPRGLSRRVSNKPLGCLRFRLRGLFGIGIRAEVIAYLASHSWGHAHDITEASAYSLAGVQQALREMADSGVLLVTRRHREKYYSLDPSRQQAILGTSEPITESLAWMNWSRLFKGFANLLRFARRQDIASASDYLQMSELRQSARRAWDEFTQAELPSGISLDVDAPVASLGEAVLGMLRELLAWLKVELRSPAPRHALDDPMEDRIIRRLQLLGPGPVSFYRDASRLMTAESKLESTTHVVGHLLRELEGAMRAVLGGPADLRGKESIRWILKKLELPEDASIGKAWLDLELHRVAHRDNLRRPRPADQEFRKMWDEIKQVLDGVLEQFEVRYGGYLGEMDRLLAISTPTASDVLQLQSRVPNGAVAMRYFFDRLDNPDWLPLLEGESFFSEPHEPVHEGTSVRIEDWPQSRYLARMAGRVPEVVHPIILRLARSKNPYLLSDCVDAGLKMAPKLSAELVPFVRDWLEAPLTPIFPEKVGELLSFLAGGREVDAALDLARILFALDSNNDEHEPRARFDAWDYNKLFEEKWPDVVKVAGADALAVLCKLLSLANETSKSVDAHGPPEDFSAIWYGEVAEFPDHRREDFRAILTRAVRDTALEVARGDDSRIATVVSVLEKEPWKIHKRIALYVLSVLADKTIELVTERLLNKRLLETFYEEIEFGQLLTAGFVKLAPQSQETFLNGIESCLENRIPVRDRDGWRSALLGPIVKDLPEAWSREHTKWLKGLPATRRARFEVRARWVGPRSPKTSEEIGKLDVPSLVGFLATWNPSGGFDSPTPEGLSQILTEAVAVDPDKYAAAAKAFCDSRRSYATAVLRGLEKSVRGKRAFSWSEVLSLCESVVGAKREAEPEDDWGRKTVADLLYAGLQWDAAGIPISERKRVWSTLYPLTVDPNPTPAEDDRFASNERPPVDVALNSIRGQALNAVVRYALWARHHMSTEPNGEERLRTGFREMPEVLSVLDAHLDVQKDSSVGVHSVYGQWFPWLVLLDRGWAQSRLDQIFPPQPSAGKYRDAAWEAYVAFCDPFNDVLKLLMHQYERAIDELDTLSQRQHGYVGANLENRLLEHLVAFYARGLLALNERGGLLTRFYARAGDRHRGLLLETIGRNLRNEEEDKAEIPSEVVERLKSLWAFRLSAAREGGGAEYRKELAAFGWWFIAKKLDVDWAVNQLRESLQLARITDPEFLVPDRLVELYPRRPREVLDCLDLMVEGAGPSSSIHAWRRKIHPVLRESVHSKDGQVRRLAERIINRLIARGHTEFKDLLPAEPPHAAM